ncbi:MAG: hypothetical protein K0M78_07145, partial [Brevundimonas sp.]|nr:hypothetical protein [Brevundimonas sp.]
MLRLTCSSALAAVLVLSAGQTPAQSQRTTGPVATYWVTARTSSGLPTGGAGFDPMAMMSGGGVQKSLHLQLQSDRTAASPDAEHEPPAGLNTGILPLVTPAGQPAARPSEFTPPSRGDGGRMRMLIYHGCGEPTGPGQPLVIEISTDDPASGASQMTALMEAVRVSPETPPSPGTGRTYGEWPNNRSSQAIPVSGSLVGDHLVRGNYTPDISFRLGADQDFMEPVQLTGVADGGSLGWNPVGGARGYFAMTMGANEAEEMIVWTSSDIPVSFGQVPDILSPSDLERLIRQGVVLPASTTHCPIPAAVQMAAPQSMLRVIAFGGEANFSYPARPANPRETWNIEHVVKVRYTSGVSTILGMDMSDLGDDDQGRGRETPDSRQPPPNPA